MTSETFQCDSCPKSYNLQGELNRHQKRHSKPFRCEACQCGFALRSDLERHIKHRHRVGNDQHRCLVGSCSRTFKRKDNLTRHVRKCHPRALSTAKSNKVMADATTTASLPQNAEISSALDPFNRIHSVSTFMQAATSGNIATLELLMNYGFTMETRADDGSTALHCAARAGHAETVQYLLGKGADARAKNESRRTPLYEGFLSNDPDTVKALVEQTPEEDLQSGAWMDSYYLAQVKNIKVFDLYTQHPKVRFRVDDANEIFRLALRNRNDALAAALLNHPNIDVNAYRLNDAPIHYAARYGNTKTMELLLASDKVEKSSTTRRLQQNALHIAARNGHANIVEQLLILKFDIDSIDSHQQTPLHLAAVSGHLKIIKLLVDKCNANLSCSDWHGQTPLHLAAFKGYWECVHVLLEFIASKARRESADIQLVNEEFVRKDVVARLLNSAAFEDPNKHCFHERNTLLHYSAYRGDLEVIEVLLAHDKIDVNARNRRGSSPLSEAVLNNQIEAVRLLLQHPQIDVNQKFQGYSALSFATMYHYQEIVELLLSHGAVDDQAQNTSTITTKDSSSLTTVKAIHRYNQSKRLILNRISIF